MIPNARREGERNGVKYRECGGADYRAGERRLTSRQRWRPVTPLSHRRGSRMQIFLRGLTRCDERSHPRNRWQVFGRWRGKNGLAVESRRRIRWKVVGSYDYLLAMNHGMFFRHGTRRDSLWRRQSGRTADCRRERKEPEWSTLAQLFARTKGKRVRVRERDETERKRERRGQISRSDNSHPIASASRTAATGCSTPNVAPRTDCSRQSRRSPRR